MNPNKLAYYKQLSCFCSIKIDKQDYLGFYFDRKSTSRDGTTVTQKKFPRKISSREASYSDPTNTVPDITSILFLLRIRFVSYFFSLVSEESIKNCQTCDYNCIDIWILLLMHHRDKVRVWENPENSWRNFERTT